MTDSVMETTAATSCKIRTVSDTAAWLSTHNNYLILTHAHPDGDTLGAGIGLQGILRMMGKTAYCVCPPPFPTVCKASPKAGSFCSSNSCPRDFYGTRSSPLTLQVRL